MTLTIVLTLLRIAPFVYLFYRGARHDDKQVMVFSIMFIVSISINLLTQQSLVAIAISTPAFFLAILWIDKKLKRCNS